jgi:hypothetical protein
LYGFSEGTLQYPSRPEKSGFPVAVAQFINTDLLASGGGMDELPLAQVNTDMRGAGLVGGEKNQVTSLEFSGIHLLTLPELT